MSNSSWPPELKAWVQNCLSKATPANKSAVNAELKEVLFRAHKDGTINTTDWTNVELQALKAQTARTTHVPAPPQPFFPVVIPPPPTVTAYPVYHPPAPSSIASSSTDQTPTKKEKKKAAKANKKRKTETTDNFPSAYHFTGPENGADDPDALARRAARFNKPPASAATGPVAKPVGVAGWFGGDDEDGGSMPGFGQVGKKRIRVGGGDVGGRYAEPIAEEDPNVIDWDRYTIKGTSNKLEKRYLRLTSEPDPADIRPLRVLEQSLQLVVKNWKENRNYAYAVDQFKSMRQDLTVQRIKNEFTVKVYEYHARVALEAKDLGEYNQCQTMLRQLYELGIHGHFEEFLSYRILYLLHTRNRGDMASLLPKLTPANKADSGVQHALQVAAAVATSNYYKIFQLYDTAPNMSGFIMDHFVERERISALAILAKSHMTLTLPYLTKTLAFEADSIADKFLVDHEIALYTNPTPALAPNASTNHWRPIKASAPTPLKERIWDCKKALVGVRKAMERYRVVDLKGQVD